jgi:hypothetical protein
VGSRGEWALAEEGSGGTLGVTGRRTTIVEQLVALVPKVALNAYVEHRRLPHPAQANAILGCFHDGAGVAYDWQG